MSLERRRGWYEGLREVREVNLYRTGFTEQSYSGDFAGTSALGNVQISGSSTKIFGSYRKLNRITKWDPMISLRHSLSDALNEWLQYWVNG